METSWTTLEDEERIAIVHDNRWLAIIGVPLVVAGLVVAIGPWFIDDARNSGAWPILAVGSLIGTGIMVAGLSLCFKYDEVIANRGAGIVIRHAGLPPFRRSKTWQLTDFDEILCVDETMTSASGGGASLHHRVRLIGPGVSVLLASCLEPEPIRTEAQRWGTFLGLPLRDTIGADLRTKLRDPASRA
jgi:hypothetical protein